MNIKTITSILLVAIVIIGAVFLLKWNKKQAPVVQAPQDSQVLVTHQPKMVSVDEDSYLLGISGSYPQFAQADASFNAKIADAIKGDITDFKNNASVDYKAKLETGGDEFQKQFTSGDYYFLNIKPDVVQSNENNISVVFHEEGYAGGAHPFHRVFTFNYGVKNKKDITVENFITLDELSRQARNLLQKKVDQSDMLNDGTDPAKPENFQAFTFTPRDLTVYFGEYQVAPYVAGEQVITIDISGGESANFAQ